MTLKGKTVLLGITSSIAVYKAAQLTSDLVKLGADVHVLMSKNATEFMPPITFETLTGNRVSVDTFDRNFQWNVQHVSLAKKADVFMIAPATANIIAKIAMGLCDDMLSTTFLAAHCPKLVAPAMNTGMYDNPATQRNLKMLEELGIGIVEPAVGRLACADVGRGKLADIPVLIDAIAMCIACEKDLAGKKVLVTAGATCESIDPVRYITNHSTGKMGIALAKAARLRGAQVTLVRAHTSVPDPYGVEVVAVTSAADMYSAVTERQQEMDIIIKSAAVADFTPVTVADQKIKKLDGQEGMSIPLARTKDILSEICKHKRPGQLICGFSMETQNLIENSRKKLVKKGADMIVANSLTEPGAGFAGDTNVAAILTKDNTEQLPLLSKDALAHKVLDALAKLFLPL